ncbi:ser thr protein phosphatase family protein, putative [Ichthyophthirius multifiliis]|uniref:Ser thr protein phosphatase family protein, putative n=1 Tax=Ichthyophthirius multifiliis TaxID=5932 RepID=G0QZA1_ICHMU|nr:ser thr protein phosphatase family protein, putative [Ichthyophthirius multifiliis]EGR29458.1 ser thr protein phosphatase family protein, putative [Ichthyophthirius multifiliis]|eukprot:XP_004030694.1 ser thr protein phosphatase family protein, putative [Ichthyophthirius multifiliis]
MQKEEISFKILHFNDVYEIEGFNQEPVGGSARFATICKKFKQENPNKSLIIFSGDLFSPSPLSIIYKGEQMIEPINACQIDIACVGNHDFDYNLQQVEQLFKKCNFPWLCSNIYDTRTQNILADNQLYSIIDMQGIKVGFMGLAEEEWLNTITEIDISILQYEDFVSCGKKMAHMLKKEQQCDIVVAITHMRMPNDRILAAQVDDIDIILGGHDHIVISEIINNCLIQKSGSDFKEYSIIDITYKPKDIQNNNIQNTFYLKQNKLKCVIETFQVTKKIEKDDEVQKIVDFYIQQQEQYNNQIIGHTNVDLDTRFKQIRTQETNFGNFYVDVLRNEVQSDVCIINSGTIRSDCIYPKGDITFSMIQKALPFPDLIVVVKCSGLKLIQALENGVSKWPSFEGRFPLVSGIKFEFDGQKQPFQRVDLDSIFIGKEKIQVDKIYSLAIKWFMYLGKDGYDMFQDCNFIIDYMNALPHLQIMIGLFKSLEEKSKTTNISSFTEFSQLNFNENRKYNRLMRLVKEIKNFEDNKYISIHPVVEGRILMVNKNN